MIGDFTQSATKKLGTSRFEFYFFFRKWFIEGLRNNNEFRVKEPLVL